MHKMRCSMKRRRAKRAHQQNLLGDKREQISVTAQTPADTARRRPQTEIINPFLAIPLNGFVLTPMSRQLVEALS